MYVQLGLELRVPAEQNKLKAKQRNSGVFNSSMLCRETNQECGQHQVIINLGYDYIVLRVPGLWYEG